MKYSNKLLINPRLFCCPPGLKPGRRPRAAVTTSDVTSGQSSDSLSPPPSPLRSPVPQGRRGSKCESFISSQGSNNTEDIGDLDDGLDLQVNAVLHILVKNLL